MAVSIKVVEFKVRSLDVDFHEITWKLESTAQDVFDYTFQVLRSEAPEGPFDVISPEMSDQYIFVDNKLYVGHEYRQFFYKLLVKETATGATREVGPASKAPEPDLVATELRKHMNLLFREFVGRRCWVFPIRTFGQRCPDCYDRTLQKRTKSQCLTCFDTTFVFGYNKPIEAWISFDPNPKAHQNTSVGPLQQGDTTARMGYWPPLKPRDVIIEPENVRWRVVQVSGTEQLRAPVHQEVSVHKIPSSDIEYRLKFETEQALKDMSLLPARNLTNPHNLDSFKSEEFPDVYQLYASSYPPVRT